MFDLNCPIHYLICFFFFAFSTDFKLIFLASACSFFVSFKVKFIFGFKAKETARKFIKIFC